jgi:hypothetical protein
MKGQIVDQNPLNFTFQSLTHVPSRRDVIRGLVGAGLGLGALRLPDVVAAGSAHHKHKNRNKDGRRTKHKKAVQVAPQPNEFGCLSVGQPCAGDSTLCCSGVCEGEAPKKGKSDTSVCTAHGQGTCVQETPDFCSAPDAQEAVCNSSICACLTTTGGSNFCAELNASRCAVCKRDADCELLGFPPGSACTSFSRGRCDDFCQSGFVCAAPCVATTPAS